MDTQDVIIIGGGITGVGIAQALAAAGFHVELWEKDKIGSHTSANSSKLIHGGLRYLETGQLSLVKQCLNERKALLTLAPNLVHPIAFYIPIYSSNKRGRLKIAVGLSLYAFLHPRDKLSKFEIIPKSQWQHLFNIKQQGLKTVFKYWDAQTDDFRLTQAVAKSAEQLGAHIRQGMYCTDIYHDANTCQLTYKQKLNKDLGQARSKLVVNACGPWVNALLDKVTPPLASELIDWVQGSHLLIDVPAPRGIFYLESQLDKRMIFVMPWHNKTLIGTTETPLEILPETLQMTMQEQAYLLAIYCHYFPQYQPQLLKDKILQQFCGVRVLPKKQGGVFDRPRDTVIKTYQTHPCLLTVYGGKLTSFRTTAMNVVRWVQSKLGKRQMKADIDKLIIHK